jgi:hypothetical protein
MAIKMLQLLFFIFGNTEGNFTHDWISVMKEISVEIDVVPKLDCRSRAALEAERRSVQDAALSVNGKLSTFLEYYDEAVKVTELRSPVESSQYMATSIFHIIHDICGENACELIFVIPLIIPVLFFELLLFVLN